MDIAKKLSFEDLSATLTESLARSANKNQGSEYRTKLQDVASALEDAYHQLQEEVEKNKQVALDQLDTTGGRTALESHLKAQKASFKVLGPKEAFLEYLSTLNDIVGFLQHDFQVDISTADNAVKTIEEEIKSRRTAISKVEQQLLQALTHISKLHNQCQDMAQKEGQELPNLALEIDALHNNMQAPLPLLSTTLTEAEVAAQQAEEDALIAKLEQDIAAADAKWADDEAAYSAIALRVQQLESEVDQLEEATSSKAEQSSARINSAMQRCETICEAVAKLHGVSMSGRGDELHLHITQLIPTALHGTVTFVVPQSSSQGAGTTSAAPAAHTGPPGSRSSSSSSFRTVQHTLSLHFHPGTTVLQSAVLSPAVVDVSVEVQAALESGLDGLETLLLEVKDKLMRHWRRQVLIEDAAELFPLQELEPEVLRAALPGQVEAEVRVPGTWPDTPSAALEVLALQAASTSVDLLPVLQRLQEQEAQGQTRGLSLRQLLAQVHNQVQAGLAAGHV